MALLTLTPGRYPVGTVLDVFQFHDASRRPGGLTPITQVTALATPVVVQGLVPNTEYVVGTELGGVWVGTKARSDSSGSGVLDRAHVMAGSENVVSGVGLANEAKLAELTLTAPYAGALYDVTYSAGVALSHASSANAFAAFRFKLDGVDIRAAETFGVDQSSMVVGETSVVSALFDRTFSRDFQVAVPTPGAHLLSVWGWRSGTDIVVLLRRYRTFRALCLGG